MSPPTLLPELSESKGRVVLAVHVQPGASRDAVAGRHGDACKVTVAARPTGGRANEAVEAVLAEAFRVPVRDVAVVSGHTSRRKRVVLGSLTLDAAARRLAELYS